MIEFTDATGATLEEGVIVGWGVGGRYSYGLALGVITSLKTEEGEHRRYNPQTRAYDTIGYTRKVVEVKSLMTGRKGRTFTAEDEFDLVVIANQAYSGNR